MTEDTTTTPDPKALQAHEAIKDALAAKYEINDLTSEIQGNDIDELVASATTLARQHGRGEHNPARMALRAMAQSDDPNVQHTATLLGSMGEKAAQNAALLSALHPSLEEE